MPSLKRRPGSEIPAPMTQHPIRKEPGEELSLRAMGSTVKEVKLLGDVYRGVHAVVQENQPSYVKPMENFLESFFTSALTQIQPFGQQGFIQPQMEWTERALHTFLANPQTSNVIGSLALRGIDIIEKHLRTDQIQGIADRFLGNPLPGQQPTTAQGAIDPRTIDVNDPQKCYEILLRSGYPVQNPEQAVSLIKQWQAQWAQYEATQQQTQAQGQPSPPPQPPPPPQPQQQFQAQQQYPQYPQQQPQRQAQPQPTIGLEQTLNQWGQDYAKKMIIPIGQRMDQIEHMLTDLNTKLSSPVQAQARPQTSPSPPPPPSPRQEPTPTQAEAQGSFFDETAPGTGKQVEEKVEEEVEEEVEDLDPNKCQFVMEEGKQCRSPKQTGFAYCYMHRKWMGDV